MPFDEKLDSILDSRTVTSDDKTQVSVQLCQYNGGAVKVQLKRESKSKGEWTFAKLGRMTPAEFQETRRARALLDQAEMTYRRLSTASQVLWAQITE